MNGRGRLTPIDVVFVGASVAVLAFMSEPIYSLISQTNLSNGVELMFVMLVPGILMSLLFAIYKTALLGSGLS